MQRELRSLLFPIRLQIDLRVFGETIEGRTTQRIVCPTPFPCFCSRHFSGQRGGQETVVLQLSRIRP